MWIWDKLTKAEIVRTENQLNIDTLEHWIVWFYGAIFFLLILMIGYSINIEEFAWLIAFFLIYVMQIIIGIMQKYNSDPLITQGNNLPKLLIPKESELANTVFPPPYFIDLTVISQKKSFNIYISNRGQKFGKFTLKTSDDLTTVIDGIVELLDLELLENRKLSEGEILSFKSKNSMLPAYSDIQIKTIPNQLILVSKTDSSKWTEFIFNKNEINNYRKSVDLTDVNKFLITDKAKIKLEVLLNDGDKIELFRHSSTEITVIRDSKLLIETLENRQELQGIEIELIEK